MLTGGAYSERRAALIKGTALLFTMLALIAAPSSAAVVELKDGTLKISDQASEANRLDVLPTAFMEQEVYDARGGLVAGAGCAVVSPRLARCSGLTYQVLVLAGGGNDVVDLSDVGAATEIHGEDGTDTEAGGFGPDQLFGEDGGDSLYGGEGVDRISGEDGDDFAATGDGADTILAGPGNDIADGGASSGDVVIGGDGQDLLRGGDGDDQLEGDTGDDVLIGGAGHDTVNTGLGQDDVFGADGDEDAVDCRPGDRIRGDTPLQPGACAALPPGVGVPTQWPPSSQPSATAMAARTEYRVHGDSIRDGAARRARFRVEASFNAREVVDVKVALRKGHSVLARKCFRDVWTETDLLKDVPARARRANNLRGEVLRDRRCS